MQQCINLINRGNSDQLNGENWSWLLRCQPQFADICAWDKLDGWAWCNLLHYQPQFVDICVWDKLDDEDWTALIFYQPQFENHPIYKLNCL